MTPRYRDRISLKSTVSFTVGSQVGEGRLLDLTVPGCLIESPASVQKGQSLQLKLLLPGLKSPLFVLLAVVRWVNGKQFGVEFIKMDESQRQILNRFMAQHLSDLAPTRGRTNAFTGRGGHNWHLETYSTSKAH